MNELLTLIIERLNAGNFLTLRIEYTGSNGGVDSRSAVATRTESDDDGDPYAQDYDLLENDYPALDAELVRDFIEALASELGGNWSDGIGGGAYFEVQLPAGSWTFTPFFNTTRRVNMDSRRGQVIRPKPTRQQAPQKIGAPKNKLP